MPATINWDTFADDRKGRIREISYANTLVWNSVLIGNFKINTGPDCWYFRKRFENMRDLFFYVLINQPRSCGVSRRSAKADITTE